KFAGALEVPILIVLLLDDVGALPVSFEVQATKTSMDTIRNKPKIVFPFFGWDQFPDLPLAPRASIPTIPAIASASRMSGRITSAARMIPASAMAAASLMKDISRSDLTPRIQVLCSWECLRSFADCPFFI